MKITFVRHGKTKSNIEVRAMGSRVDEDLLAEGIEDAKKTANELPTHFTRLYVSPLRRAFSTARIINTRLNIPIEVRSELVERDFGTLSGTLWSDMLLKTKGWMSREIFGNSDEHDFSDYIGESKIDMRERLYKFLNHLKKNHKEDERILVVTHGGVVRVTFSLLGRPIPKDSIKNGSQHEIEI